MQHRPGTLQQIVTDGRMSSHHNTLLKT